MPDVLPVPMSTRFPVELRPPSNFDPEDLSTWPRVEGRLEYVGGKLLYTPPLGEPQSAITANIGGILWNWVRIHSDLRLRTNEAGMKLGPDVRAADAAVWPLQDLVPGNEGLIRSAPVLAIEVAGLSDDPRELREKVRWYLDAGVHVVWLVLPRPRQVVVCTRRGERSFAVGESIPAEPELPGLVAAVEDIFRD